MIPTNNRWIWHVIFPSHNLHVFNTFNISNISTTKVPIRMFSPRIITISEISQPTSTEKTFDVIAKTRIEESCVSHLHGGLLMWPIFKGLFSQIYGTVLRISRLYIRPEAGSLRR